MGARSLVACLGVVWVLTLFEFAVVLEEPGNEVHIGFQGIAIEVEVRLASTVATGRTRDATLERSPVLKCGIIVEDLLFLHALKKITEALVEDLDDLLADARTHLLQVVNDGVHYVEVVVVHYLEALDGGPARAHTFRDLLYVPQ